MFADAITWIKQKETTDQLSRLTFLAKRVTPERGLKDK
jgi:hypothetical protein